MLFRASFIGNLRVKNRILMAPMAIGGLVEPDGRFSNEAINFYKERAKGGVGLITTGLCIIENEVENHLIKGMAPFPMVDSGAYIPRLSKLADAVHDYGAKIAVQLTAGFGRVAPRFLMREGQPPAPSILKCFWDPTKFTRELTIEEIQRLVKAFAVAARVLIPFCIQDDFNIQSHPVKEQRDAGEHSNRFRPFAA